MEAVPDFKKGGGGLRYLKITREESDEDRDFIFFTSLAMNTFDLSPGQVIFSLDIQSLIDQPPYTSSEGFPLLFLNQ